jgi:iron complex transport system ATP-binding protein
MMAAHTDIPAPNGGTASRAPFLEARGLSAAYGERVVFRGVDLSLAPGMLTALIGPNGAGKSTLLHTLSGILPSAAGSVLLHGRPLQSYSRREIARRIALVPQAGEMVGGITVEETVALGRYPWMGPVAPPSPEDRAQIEAALGDMDLVPLRGRRLETLSGGERQRVFLARALAQATPALLLDEPAANLDLRYQQETFERLRALVASRGVAVLVAEHQLNLVAAACDRVLVLHAGALSAQGTPQEILTETLLHEVFGARMRVTRDARGRPQCLWDF